MRAVLVLALAGLLLAGCGSGERIIVVNPQPQAASAALTQPQIVVAPTH
jgi:uncharacterized protein YcfL